MSKTAFRVLVPLPLDAAAEARLAAEAEIVRCDAGEEAICRAIVDCDALVARTHLPVTRRILEAGGRLRVVGVAGVGLDNVDERAAAERGIAVLHTPAASSDAVAELTVAFMLLWQRPIPRLADAYRNGRFRQAREAPHGRELRELTIGIVGMGRIGARVGRICAAGLGARVIYNDILPVGPFDFAASPVEKDSLWREADVVTLHVPLTDATRGLIDARILARLRTGALLINTSRGAVVDTPALLAALRSGRMSAALDVADPEPLPPDHPLLNLPNCVVTPHIAARTEGGLRRMFDVVDQVAAFLRDRAGS